MLRRVVQPDRLDRLHIKLTYGSQDGNRLVDPSYVRLKFGVLSSVMGLFDITLFCYISIVLSDIVAVVRAQDKNST